METNENTKTTFWRGLGRTKRNCVRLFVAACAVWFFWYPLNTRLLYLAMPRGAVAVSYHKNMAAEWRALCRTPTIVEALTASGVVEDPDDLLEESGIYQTLFWLTGKHSVLGYVPANPLAGTPEYLAGASYVGWKAKIMELLWRIKWVPGLGKLETTENGTRYMTFRHSRTMRELGLVLGLDMENGMLLATLSTNPDTVNELSFRARNYRDEFGLARAFGGVPESGETAKPWKRKIRGNHAVTARLPIPGTGETRTVNTEIDTLKNPNLQIRFSWNGGDAEREIFGDITETILPETFPAPLGNDLPQDAAFAIAMIAPEVIDALGTHLSPPLNSADAPAVFYLSSKPYEGRVSFLDIPYPALNLILSWNRDDDFSGWFDTWFAQLDTNKDLMLFASERNDRGHTQKLFGSALLEPNAKPKKMFFMEERNGVLHAGSHYGSYQKQLESHTAEMPSIADKINTWCTNYPYAFCFVEIDMKVLQKELSNVAAIVSLASRINRDVAESVPPDTIELFKRILKGAAAFGNVEFVLEKMIFVDDDGTKTDSYFITLSNHVYDAPEATK